MNFLLKPITRLRYARLLATLGQTPQPIDAPQAHGSGPNPDRVLVFGSGAAFGAGVMSHQLALPGRLATELSHLTGRGADIDLRVHRKRNLATAPRELRNLRLSTYDAIVVTFGPKDAFALTTPQRWSVGMNRLLDTISDTSPVSTPIVLAGTYPLPPMPGLTPSIASIVNSHSRKLNLITEQLCAQRKRASFVPLPAPEHSQENRHRTSRGYSQWARLIATHLAPRLPSTEPDTGDANSARQLRSRPQCALGRRRALSDLSLARSEPEMRFDRVVLLARAYFDTQCAAFTLSDGQSEWIKSRAGFRGTVRLEPLSAAVIDSGGPLAIGDVSTDDRFRQARMVGGSALGFYAGYPVEAPDGHRIGVLSVFDQNPRRIRTVDNIMLRDLAMLLQRELWNRTDPTPANA